MARFQNSTFRNDILVLDGNEYEGCEFKDCTLIYRGGLLPRLAPCLFFGYSLRFEGAAENTILLLAALYQDGFQADIEQTFTNIRTNRFGTRSETVH